MCVNPQYRTQVTSGPYNDLRGAVVAAALQLGGEARAGVEPPRLLHAGHHGQARRQAARRGRRSLPQHVVRGHVTVADAHLLQPL